MSGDRLAAIIVPDDSLADAVEQVRLAERLGYEAVFSIHIAARDALMTLVPFITATSTIKLGTAVVPAFPRHPVALAVEAATLDEASGGRLILGIGPSHQITMENWFGISMERPLSRMKEYVTILRSLFTTDQVSFSGEFYSTQFGFLGYGARRDLPIYVSALSPRMLRWAGAVADGVLLWSCLPSYIERVVTPTVRAGAIEAGRDPGSVDIVALIPTALTHDTEASLAAYRTEYWTYMNMPFYRRVLAAAGYSGEIAAFDKAVTEGDFAGQLESISERMLIDFCAVGDVARIHAKLEEYRKAGVTMPALFGFDAGPSSGGFDATLEAAIKTGNH